MSIKRLSTTIPDLYALDSILPEHLRENTQFIEWIETYLEWQQSTANSPAFIINKLNEIRDIDRVEEIFIQYLQNEYAIGIPSVAKTDKRKLYKQVNDIYRSKGSTPSYEALFNLLFNESIELYFPRVDLLKPSEGKWNNDSKRYLNNNGFLSDRKYIQDSYYYQDFSYVIKTGQTIETWKDTVKKLLHPAGFAFFGQINIVSTSLVATVRSPLIQPGSAAGKPEALPFIADLVTVPSAARRFNRFMTVNYAIQSDNYFGGTIAWLEQTKFTMNRPMNQYSDITIEIAGSVNHTNRMPGSEIVIS